MIAPVSSNIVAGLLFLFTLLTGYWVSRSGRPYSVVVLAIHKLVALGALVFLIVTAVQVHKTTGLTPTQWLVSSVIGILFVGTIATGGMLIHDFPDGLSEGGWLHNYLPMQVAPDEILTVGMPSEHPRQMDGQSEP